MIPILIIIIVGIIVFRYFWNRNHWSDNIILSIYFGVPGSGKSTFAAYTAKQCIKHKYPVYSNFPIIGAYKYEADDLGKYHIENAKIIIDEAGIDFNNRAFKSFSDAQNRFFKLHRHYKVSIDVYSQTYNDMDKKIRNLAQRLYIVRRSRLPWFVSCVPIRKKIDIDNINHDIVDGYYFDHPIIRLFTTKRAFMPRYWSMFDSYKKPELDHHEFPKYDKA